MGKKKDKYDSSNVVIYAWKRRKILLTITFFAFIVSVIASLLITPRFKSSVVMFPTAAASVSGSLLSESMFASNDLLKFGGEEEGEQLMQILQSQEIRNRIVLKYDLMRHYRINADSPYAHTLLNEQYDSNIKVRRTELMSIVVDVLDADPDTAAFIANDISNYVDTVMNQMTRERAQKALSLVENEYNQLSAKINLLQDSLKKIRALGVVNYESQSEALSTAYAQAVRDNNQIAAGQLQRKLDVLAKYGGSYVSLRDFLLSESKRLSLLTAKYQQAKVDAEQNLPYKYIVDKAYRSDRKATPKRMIIVLASTVSTFFLALLLLVIADTLRLKKKD